MGTSVETPHLTIRCQFCETWNRVDAARAGDRPKCGKCGTPVLLDRPLKLDDATFERTIRETDVPVLVDFYADWCAPCKVMSPLVDELAVDYLGRALIAKLDTDRSAMTSQGFQVRGIPTSIVFRSGKEVSRQVGAVPKAGLVALLESAI
jgi:thioredoxin 2